jgi:uncharacterized protein YjbJ (UPF0337 family)
MEDRSRTGQGMHDQAEGKLKQDAGDSQAKFGKQVDDKQLKAEGEYLKDSGKAQEKLGKKEEKLERDRP